MKKIAVFFLVLALSLTLIPVVLGAALYGPFAGAWLGGVSAVIFFFKASLIS